jgi:hypothetical protein
MCGMKRSLLIAAALVIWAMAPVFTQAPTQAGRSVPELPFESVPDP